MQRKSGLMLLGAGAVLFTGVLIAAGCGGGGPTTPQVAALGTAQMFRALFPAGQKLATPVGTAKCVACHAANCTTQATTRHAQVSVTCENCHGPGSAHIAAPSLTNILRGTQSLSTAVCGQCHSDIVGDFSQSVHAQIVTDVVTATGSSTTCMRCHSDPFHTLKIEAPLAQNPPQTPAQIDTAIVATSSTDMNTFAAATAHTIACAGCHDPHQNTQNLTSAGEQFYLRAATASSDLSSDPPNATPAAYTTVNQVCGMCHNNRGGDPSDKGLTKNTSRPATHEGPEYNMLNGVGGAEGADAVPPLPPPAVRTSSHVNVPDQCITCHMPNSRHTFTVSFDTSCAPCHTPTDAASRANTVQTEVQNALAALQTRMANWAVAQPWNTAKDPLVWDYSSNLPSTSKFPTQTNIPIEVKRARHNYYFILLDRSYGVHNFVYTQYLLNLANVGLDPDVPRSVSVPLSRQEVKAMLSESLARAKYGQMTSNNLGAN